MAQRNTALGSNAAVGTLDGLALPSTYFTLAQNTRVVKSRQCDAQLSRALDRTIVNFEASRGIVRAVWRARKAFLERQIVGAWR